MTKVQKVLSAVVAWEEMGDYELGIDAQGEWTGWQRIKYVVFPCWNHDMGINIGRDGILKYRKPAVVRIMGKCRQRLSAGLRGVITLARCA